MQHETMPNFLKKRAFLTPERTAVYFNDQTISFKELYEKSYETAGQLKSLGVKKDQYIGVILKNHFDTVVILFALQLMGVKAVILNNRLSKKELVWQVNDSKAAAVILENEFYEISQSVEVPVIKKEDLFAATLEIPEIQEEIHLNDVCTVMYTSGTTGYPKGVLHTYGNHWWSAVGSALNLGYTDRDRWLCSVPLFHISGYSILMKSVIYGMPIILHESFDANKAIGDIKSKHVTIMSVVGTMLFRMVEALEGSQLPNYFRCALLGGGPAPLPLLEVCKAKAVPVFQSYGMTETASQIVTLAPEYSITKLGSAGKPLFPSQIEIILENGGVAQANQAGEIIVKGPNVTMGYLNRPEVSKEKFNQGWFHTGDIGYMDEEGFLYVLDRRSDLIISGGENIYPAEIESVLLAHPDVADAGVTGFNDETWGQVPVAFIVPKKNAKVTEEELIQFCLVSLAKYKIPKSFYFTKELPRNASKKLLRRKLSELVHEGRIQK
ncbi:o-succinylbenzoate--CoA ligase [Neobacillus sp. DY30]|uniref:o-succinylbenzoate--CoA ligase n=1 Tax=Neobacillus sp. DY30 TaxID=3047871 RepID=UPI0024BF734F|nr:o-succinylbenzoate--CoA ligase [Neobacillus sp. DY30]WHX99696.1 o-succinylbenzoate--CoA ligase [Neobacillus sp. DY30]